MPPIGYILVLDEPTSGLDYKGGHAGHMVKSLCEKELCGPYGLP